MPDMDDETNYILFKALWAELQANDVPVAMSDVTTIAYGVRLRLKEMGMSIQVDEAQALERGREVKLHE